VARRNAATDPGLPGSLFGDYDIRGRYPRDFSALTCRRIADAFLSATRGPFVVAIDTRRASARLERSIVGPLTQGGRTVLRLGVQPTPVVGFASSQLGRNGLVFTPSHNALGDAGIKAFGRTGKSLGAEWSRIRRAYVRPERRARARATVQAPGGPDQNPRTTTDAVVAAYLSHVTRGLDSSLSVVVDGRGGATSRLAPRALRLLGGSVTELHPHFSSAFYGLSPEPQPENVHDLGRAVRGRGADLGVAFDGDGDRVAFVDERGKWVEPEVVGLFLHRSLSSADRPLVASVDASQRCEGAALTVRSRVGSRYLSAAMRAHGSSVGFEVSSHFYLRRWGPNSDGILTACVVCHLLAREQTSLGALARAFGPIVRDRRVLEFSTRAQAVEQYRGLQMALGQRSEKVVDGFKLRARDGSILLRLSNTQPAIRLVLEPDPGRSLAALRRVWSQVSKQYRLPRP